MDNTNKTIRLRTTPGGEDKHLNLKVEQSFDFLEVLSLKISQEDLYSNFCANYGVVVGRVLANKAFGVPNAKVSLFIPISSEDEKNLLIKDLYPYKLPSDKNSQGVRYNLLLSKTTCELNTPVGTFPDKETLLSNDIMIEVFEKYYKYTTKTNESGDYMLFGVPVGQRTIHMDADLSDAGMLSVRPYDLIAQGAPVDFFESSAKFKNRPNIDVLPQIKTSDQGLDVIPFWGDPENCELGITRLDIDTNTDILPTALFMGSIFSDKEKNSLNKRCNPTNDMGELEELRTGAGEVQFIRAKEINPVEWVLNKKAVPTALEFHEIKGGDIIDEDGTFAVTVPMNVGHVVTNEVGELVPSEDPTVGLPTKAIMRMKAKFSEDPSNAKRRTANLIIPSLSSDQGGTKGYTSTGDNIDINGTEDQRFTDNLNDYKDIDKDFQTFEWKQLYTIAQYIKKYKKGGNRWSFIGLKNTDAQGAANNPMPFNTAIQKPDFLYALGSFFLNIGAFFIKLLVILIGLQFGFYFGLNISFTIFGTNFCIIRFYNVLVIQPFGWIGNIMPKFCDSEDTDFCCNEHGPEARGFILDCDGNATCIRTDSAGGGPCGPGGGAPCAGFNTCDSGGQCCSGGVGGSAFATTSPACGCPQDIDDGTSPIHQNVNQNNLTCGPQISNGPPPNNCEEKGICLKGFGYVPSVDNCDAMASIQDWLCCRILELAEKRNVIRRCLIDAWMVGSAYLFQYKYKVKMKKEDGAIVKQESFCGPGSDKRSGNNYGKNKCCPHEPAGSLSSSCAHCLIRGSEETDVNVTTITDYHKTWHNNSVNGLFGSGNGATDINDNIYCNNAMSTKIVSLGRVEMCPDTLNEIENCIEATNCVFNLYKQHPDYFVGTFYEDGWDPNFWSKLMSATSYQSPKEVLQYLLTTVNCKLNKLFKGSFNEPCHEQELKNDNYQFIKEVAKIYTDVNTCQTDSNNEQDQFEPGADCLEQDSTGNYVPNGEQSGFVFDARTGQRFAPCGGYGNCNQPPLPWSGQDIQSNGPAVGPGNTHNASKNIPYYYFGLNPGKTAIDKLKKQFFVN